MIDLNSPVKNTIRKFGSADRYYVTQVQTLEGDVLFALFTENEIETAINRADENAEDIELLLEEELQSKFGKFVTWLSSFFGSTRQ